MRRPDSAGGRVVSAALVWTAVLAVLCLVAPPGWAPSGWAPEAAAQPSGAASAGVTLRVDDVTPTTPQPSHTPQPLTVTLTLHNSTATALRDVVITAFRGDPIANQLGLDRSIRRPTYNPDYVQQIPDTKQLSYVPPHQSVDIPFTTTTDIPQDAGVCLCQDRIYPLWFTATEFGEAGTATSLAVAQTYIPAFTEAPPKLQVAWLWPLLDRPHRGGPVPGTTGPSDNVFLDDQLASELAPGGRLDTLLQVVEDVGRKVPLTLLVDPDLIDEIAVMATGDYIVRTPGSTTSVPGTGATQAAAWLARLRAVLTYTDIVFTPFGDPDVNALVRHHMTWSDMSALDPAAQTRVVNALGGNSALTDVSWPAGGVLSRPALAALARRGTSTVVLGQRSFAAGRQARTTALDAVARVPTGAGPVTAALTSPSIQRWARRVLAPQTVRPATARRPAPPSGLSALPQLVSEVAVHAVESTVESPPQSHFVLITPPRQLGTVNVAVADRAVLETARTMWSSPILLRQAVASVTPASYGALISSRASGAVPPSTLWTLRDVTTLTRRLAPLFVGPDNDQSASQARLGAVAVGVQRCESSSLLHHPAAQRACAARLRHYVADLRQGVHLVKPAKGTYTLASRNSVLPVTVANTFNVPVWVDIAIRPVSNIPGFTARTVEDVSINPNSTHQFRVPTEVDRTGRIPVRVILMTTTGVRLGKPVALSVHSTALGTVGVVITVAAGVVLVVALLLRVLRRWRRHAGEQATADQPAPGKAAPEKAVAGTSGPDTPAIDGAPTAERHEPAAAPATPAGAVATPPPVPAGASEEAG